MDSHYRCFRAKKRDTRGKMGRIVKMEASERRANAPPRVLPELAPAVTRAARTGSRGRRAVDVRLGHSEREQQAALRLVGEDERRPDLGLDGGSLRRRGGGGASEDEREEVDLLHRVAELVVDGVDEEVGDEGI